MSSSNSFPETSVEDMSNAELFQFLFKAEIHAGLPLSYDDDPTHSNNNIHAPSPPSSSSSLSSPYTSTSSDNSPTTSSLSFSSPPYQQPDGPFQEQQQQQQLQQEELFPSMLQPQAAATYPVLLPSSSFSYRQISPDMPPSMPTQLTLPTLLTNTANDNDQFLSLAQTATSTIASGAIPPQHMAYFMQRVQQLQQLQQIHHQQQQQFFTSPLFSGNSPLNQDYNPSSLASDRSVSPSSSTSKTSLRSPDVKSEKIYPSPPMKDDVSMDSDSDDGHNDGEDGGPDPLKPSPSELKKMTSKERRQLRNKLSARNFRVRRKEYISTLEAQVKEARREAAELQKKLAQSELNCQILRQELDTTRLSQSLFNDSRMPKEHANLLASLLNPNTESFPTSSPVDSVLSSTQQQELQQRELMESINHNNMTILNNSLTAQSQASTGVSVADASQGSLQPFVPFDGNWELIVNRAEMFVDPALDPKDVQSKEAVYHDLLARYEAAKHEAEVDEQMRTELKAYHEQKLGHTYIVMPKDDAMLAASNKASQDTWLLQTMVYMMMIHLTRSMFEAATLSTTQLVNVYQTMDEPLRSKMGQEQQERSPCKFTEWREAWIRKCWPSFYNNRQRVCELLKNGICPSSTLSSEVDVDETVRKMEEGVKDKTVEPQPGPFCLWLRDRISSLLRCPEQKARQEREALLSGSKHSLEVVA
ncbi:hypothetical protein EDD21DRAFT_404946 [Dissophora ornata]|nr:hypothetical protein BGZ58_005195 [Dissophora ornata]KAI8600812.1 hypothetical protein EDD21DRAFT_404946 [Dissophora ornata]